MLAEETTQVWDLVDVEDLLDTPGRQGHAADPRWIVGRQLCTDTKPRPEVPVDMLCITAIEAIFARAECQRLVPTMVPQQVKGGLK